MKLVVSEECKINELEQNLIVYGFTIFHVDFGAV